MNPNLWRQAEDLFHAALEQAPEDRRAFVGQACGENTELRQQVEMLISQEEHAGSFLARPALDELTATLNAPPSLVGRQLGPYRLVSLLGAGGMGEVYRAHDSKLGRDVAIKTLPAEFAGEPDRLARFRREARTLASLNHPNIAAIYGLEESDGVDCLVLELVEGETLRGPLAVSQALDCARQVAEALEAAHAKGIIHRDLKPANVKLTPEGRVKVLDFGLAKALWGSDGEQDLSQRATITGLQTQAGHIVGTPGYMSPEQARGKEVDQRTDVWAFGCLLYELLTGKRAFEAETVSDTIAAILEREPEWQALPPRTPAKIRELLRQCLQKDPDRRRLQIADARRIVKDAQRGWQRWKAIAVAAAGLAVLGVGSAFWLHQPPVVSDSSQWTQLTKFPDSVTQPALSPDGRMVAFIRGPSTFIGQGQIYVKMLPDGEPVQLTHDNYAKLMPAFSPDGSRLAYTTYLDNGFSWDTWSVPVLGGEPQKWLKNASGLLWTGPRQLLFSEIKMGLHMGIVAADENRMGARNIYLPAGEACMAHRSYLSPDRKWVLLVEMDEDHLWLPCRVVPADGSSPGHVVGPADGGCTAGAWSPDGKWMYLTSNAVGANHIWRQRFPDGKPEQITSGPTAEEGIAMAPDGRSFITAVALQSASLWIHSSKGEREVSLEGAAAEPKFTPDGKTLLYRVVKEPLNEQTFYRDAGELRAADLETGRSEPLLRGFPAFDYDISADGRQIVLETADNQGKSRLWIAPLDRSSPPRQIPNVEGNAPRFGPGGHIFFRRREASRLEMSVGSVYRVRADGSGLQKALDQPVLFIFSISPDYHWLHAWAPLAGNGPPAFQVLPLEEGEPVVVGSAIQLHWPPDQSSVAISSPFGAVFPGDRWYLIPLSKGQALPPIPAGGFRSEEEIARLPGARRIDNVGFLTPGPTGVYAYYRSSVQRNLYRIPLP